MQDAGWSIKISTRIDKEIRLLPEHVQLKLFALIQDLKTKGPTQHSWPHYSKLGVDTYHCHLKKGRPTYVACWQVLDKRQKIIEVHYAGTHEKAPY